MRNSVRRIANRENKSREQILGQIRGGVIVSCQALPDEPLYGSEMMAHMADAAVRGGAVGIRANTSEDIRAIQHVTDLPIIGIIKKEYKDSKVYITPTMQEVDELVKTGVCIIALDATDRKRPGGISLEDLFTEVRVKYPNQLFMADCSCIEDGIRAERLGFDLVDTTLRGYTADTADKKIPDYAFLHELTEKISIPVIAEGGIWETGQLQKVFAENAFAAVIGTAITRPRDITRRFVDSIVK